MFWKKLLISSVSDSNTVVLFEKYSTVVLFEKKKDNMSVFLGQHLTGDMRCIKMSICVQAYVKSINVQNISLSYTVNFGDHAINHDLKNRHQLNP